MNAKQIFFFQLLSLLFVAAANAQQDCPGIGPWRLKCPQYCCLQDFDEPLEGQYCCSSCRYSYDAAVRNEYQCTASHYLHQSWAVVLMACGIAFILLVCCTCCCCCCCAPCRQRRQRRAYISCESGKHHQYQHRYYGSGAAPMSTADSRQNLLPSAPPASISFAVAGRQHKGGDVAAEMPQPPPYQQQSGGSAEQQSQLPSPPTYRP